MTTTAAVLVALLAAAAAGCGGDSTDISGEYFGNATYVGNNAGSDVAIVEGGEVARVNISDVSDSTVGVAIGDGCALEAEQLHQVDVMAKGDAGTFVFTSEDLDAGQACTLMLGGQPIALTITEGSLVADNGGTMTLELGGAITSGAGSGSGSSAPYLVYNFSGAD